jgi:hypothetical protein
VAVDVFDSHGYFYDPNKRDESLLNDEGLVSPSASFRRLLLWVNQLTSVARVGFTG